MVDVTPEPRQITETELQEQVEQIVSYRPEFAEIANSKGVLYNSMTVATLNKVANGLLKALDEDPDNETLRLKLDAAEYYIRQKSA